MLRRIVILTNRMPQSRFVARRFNLLLRPGQLRALSIQSLNGDSAAKAELRLLLHEAGWRGDIARLSDTELMGEVQRILRDEDMLLDAAAFHIRQVTGGVRAEPKAAPAPTAPAPREPKAEEPEAATFGSDHNAAAQAAALKAAAAAGAPFCDT